MLEKTYLQHGPALIVQATFLRVPLAFSYPLESRAMLPPNIPQKRSRFRIEGVFDVVMLYDVV